MSSVDLRSVDGVEDSYDDFTVFAKAQVMTRDDSSGGWVPLGGGGMSAVGLRQFQQASLPLPPPAVVHGRQHVPYLQSTYRIYGQRLVDRTVVLDCSIDKSLEYTRANPTFHHWRTAGRRFGLAFQTSTEALLFERSVRSVIEATSAVGSGHDTSTVVDSERRHEQIFNPHAKRSSPADEKSIETTSAEKICYRSEDLFRVSSQQNIEECVDKSEPINVTIPELIDCHQCVLQTSRTEYVHFAPTYMTSPSETEVAIARYVEPSVRMSEAGGTSLTISTSSVHEYSYCGGETTLVSGSVSTRLPPEVSRSTTTLITTATSSGISTTAVHVAAFTSQPALPIRVTGSVRRQPRLIQLWRCRRGDDVDQSNAFECEEVRRVRTSSASSSKVGIVSVRPICAYCSEPFDPASNRPGRCPDAPDRAARLVDRAACMCCARAVVYHCLRPDEDDCYNPKEPRSIGGQHGCHRRDLESVGAEPYPDVASPPIVVDLPSTEGDVEGDPCACNGTLTPLTRCKRWSVLAALSVFVPCLWCYWPMVACHRCAVETGCCGGRHRSVTVDIETRLGGVTTD